MTDKEICICLDTTSSMQASLEACKESVRKVCKLFGLLKLKITLILFGDYQRMKGKQTVDNVVTIIQGAIPSVLVKLKGYRLSQNGHGGDWPEALTTALNFAHRILSDKSSIIIITDAVYHNYYYNNYGANMCEDGGEGQVEIACLQDAGMFISFTDVLDALMKKKMTVDIISSYAKYKNAYQSVVDNEGVLCYLPALNQAEVTNSLFAIINYRITGGFFPPGVQFPPGLKFPGNQATSGGELTINFDDIIEDKLKYFGEIYKFVSDNPTVFPYLSFIAQPYFNIVRKYKKSADHSKLCDILKTAGVSKDVIEWFKGQAVERLHLNEINLKIIDEDEDAMDDLAIVKNEHIDYNRFLDMLTVLSYKGDASINLLKTVLQKLTLIKIDSEEFDPNKHLALNAVVNEPSLLCSFICFKEGDEFMRQFVGVNMIVVSAILQWCKDNMPELIEIMKVHITRKGFMKWTHGGIHVPDSIFNSRTLDFVRQGLAPYETTANKKIFDRIVKLIQVSRIINQNFEQLGSIIKPEAMNPREKVRYVNGVYVATCPMIANKMPTNIFKRIDLAQYEKIRQKMENYIKLYGFGHSIMFSRFKTYEKWSDYMNNVRRLICDLGSIFISTYGLYFGEQCKQGLDYMTPDGVIDIHTYTRFVDKVPKDDSYSEDSDESGNGGEDDPYIKMLTYYMKHIGKNGEYLLSKKNIVPKKYIHKDGPMMVCCTKHKGKIKKGYCGAIYQVMDSSGGAVRVESTCAECRLGNVTLYRNTCTTCKTHIAMGEYLPQLSEDECIFCSIPDGIRTHYNISTVALIKENMAIFSAYLGVPEVFLERLIAMDKKPARAIREDVVDNKDANITNKILHPSMLDDEGWTSSKDMVLNGITYQGCILNDKSIQSIVESIDSGFRLDCPFCCELCPVKNMTKCHKCEFRYCLNCATTMFGNTKWFNQEQDNACFSCPACRTPVLKGFARKHKYWLLYNALKRKLVAEVLEDPKKKLKTCGNPDCVAECRSHIVVVGACGPAGEEGDGADAEVEAEDPNKPNYLECHECLSDRKSKELQASREEAEQRRRNEMEAGTKLPNGYYINQDGLVFRPCPYCGAMGLRDDHACWNMTCTNPVCRQHYCWCCDEQVGDVYGHLTRRFGTYYVSGSIYADPENRNMYISTVDGPINFETWTEEEHNALARARAHGDAYRPGVNYNYNDPDYSEDEYNDGD